jgi:hypothetical protein
MPAGFTRVVQRRALNWGYSSEPEPALGGRVVPVPRGRVLGGSSSINGMFHIRGDRRAPQRVFGGDKPDHERLGSQLLQGIGQLSLKGLFAGSKYSPEKGMIPMAAPLISDSFQYC